MSKNFDGQKYEKVIFRLEKDAGGYPPDDWESLWAYEVEPGLYSIDNVPFFARGVSWGDVVSVERRGNELHFKEVVRPSRHSVIRVIVYDSSQVAQVHENLKSMKCDTEQSHFRVCLQSIVRPLRICEKFGPFWKKGEADGRWTYEEASIRETA